MADRVDVVASHHRITEQRAAAGVQAGEFRLAERVDQQRQRLGDRRVHHQDEPGDLQSP